MTHLKESGESETVYIVDYKHPKHGWSVHTVYGDLEAAKKRLKKLISESPTREFRIRPFKTPMEEVG